CQQGNSNPFTF
nr:immunoglobulin light chain junction region [Macaca mulatta]MOV74244.1 immunoglobulin light chain junction region [Macaca mulatta]MOV74279.1 immunoglobulin light chain junction region [Macaca mulatta]MOV74378.1 immunoglobulin light chain junction region [Macaca mulatta]MOV74481.1 immunoglobulin light chain junction region [Macaca mulatta]